MNGICRMMGIGLLMVGVVGCATSPIKPQKNFSVEEIQANITTCQTTVNDLKKIYGEPDVTGITNGYIKLVWFYTDQPKMDELLFRKYLTVFVNKNDVVVDYDNKNNPEAQPFDKCTK